MNKAGLTNATAERLSGIRVLVVEDEYYIADDLRRTLKSAGASIVGPFGSIAPAAAAIEKGGFDCALLDLNLHGESAASVADRLKALGIPFAIATGYASGAVPERHEDVPRLEKPFEPSEVIEMISRWDPVPRRVIRLGSR